MQQVEPYQYGFIISHENMTLERQEHIRQWMKSYGLISVASSAVYLFLIFIGKRYMRTRERFSLRVPLILWSGLLAIFSIVGAVRTVPEIVYIIKNYGFHTTLVDVSFYDGVCGFWTLLFTWSKLWELGDTAFIVLRKQQLIVLHWYHHITVMMYTWIFYYTEPSLGRWFMSMNFTVHGFMYTYFTLRAIGIHVPKAVNFFITSLQIIQMLTALCLYIYIYSRRYFLDEQLALDRNTEFCGFVMYLSYFVLFINFFYHTYVKKPTKMSPPYSNGQISDHKNARVAVNGLKKEN